MTPALKASPRPAPRFGFGDRLRLVRREMGLSQAEMAIRIGVGGKAYSAWESGQARPADLPARALQLENITGIARSWWLGWDDLPPTDGDGQHSESGAGSPSSWGPATDRYADCDLPAVA
jgi:transcriptional regulator with XRE-family HTH domain